jgi:hypothetical protein
MSDKNNTLRRSMTVVPKIISEKEGLVDYVASNETLDSYNEVISAKGWRFTRFAKNAPFVDSHNYWSIDKLLGAVESARIEARNLIERVMWAKDVEENKLAQLGWKMTLGGFLKAVSVGFFPVRYVANGKEGWNAAVSGLGIPAEAAAEIRYIYLEQEQIELSACIIGANPDALAKSFEAGCVKDADLAAVGFTDDDMSFLTIAGKALDKPDLDELTRSLIAREMGRITARDKHSPGSSKHHTSDSPGKPGGGELAERQAAERAAFVRSLNEALK